MGSANDEESYFLGTVKSGIGAGLIAGVALFSAFLSIDQQLGLPHGLFFKTMQTAFGVDAVLTIFIGLCAAGLIGISYNLVSSHWNTFRIITPTKGILTGAATGAIIFGLIFLPLHTLVLLPTVESEIISNESLIDISPKEKESLKTLLFNNTYVLWYSAFLHVVFGSVLGLMSGFVLHDRYINVKRIRSFW
jgi:hypothetical protein